MRNGPTQEIRKSSQLQRRGNTGLESTELHHVGLLKPTLGFLLLSTLRGQIKEATGMTSVSDMVNNFLQAEEKNFSLFNFVNELNRCVFLQHK